MVIALGYGEGQGNPHRSKDASKVSELEESPEWFRKGLEAALLAPTAVNQQKFSFGMQNGEPTVRVKGSGACTQVDLGIVALHFEIGSGKQVKKA